LCEIISKALKGSILKKICLALAVIIINLLFEEWKALIDSSSKREDKGL